MKKLCVLIIRNAYQQDTGGAEQYAVNLCRAFKNVGFSPLLVTNHTAINKQAKEHKIRTIKSMWYEKQEWNRWYYARYIYTTLWYMWVILRYRIQVVNPQGRDDFVFATNAARILRRKVVWTDHADLKYLMDRINHRHPRMQAWLLQASHYASAIICVSKSEKISIEKVAPELSPKLVVVHNGVFRPKDVKPVPKSKFIIGTNARLVASKGIGEIIEAFSQIQKDKPDSELWLLGGESGNKDRYFEMAKENNVEKRVKFLGYVPNPNDYVAGMDIFVHASYHEAFSLAIIEAAMLGRPIIATDVGGTPEIIDTTTGLLVPPRSSEKLAQALLKFIRDEKLARKLAAAVQTRAETDFDFQTIVEKKLAPLYGGSI